MSRDGELWSDTCRLEALIRDLRTWDCFIENHKLKQILSHGSDVVPHLENILHYALKESPSLDLGAPQKDSDWFVVVHALYLLAQLQSNDSLELVLQFLAQKQEVLDYWLHDLVQDDVWEVIFFLGQNRLPHLEAFLLNQKHNIFSRLTVGTTLIQLGLHFHSRRMQVVDIFKKVLTLENEEPDFIGLLVSEVLDLREEALRPAVTEALRRNEVWSGIISLDEVRRGLRSKNVRKLRPLGVFERYKLLRQFPYFAKPSTRTTPQTLYHLKSHKPF